MYSNNAILVLQWTHSMDSIWTPYGLHMDSIWTCSMDSCMDILYSIWTPHGVHVESIWNNPGSVKTSTKVLSEPPSISVLIPCSSPTTLQAKFPLSVFGTGTAT